MLNLCETEPFRKEQLPTGTERILFVDDELAIAKMSKQNLKGIGYQVTMQIDSIEALDLFRKRPNDFDLVITDMTMPKMTGDDLAVEIIKIRNKVNQKSYTLYQIEKPHGIKNIADFSEHFAKGVKVIL